MAGVGVQVAQEGLETYGGMDTKPRKVLAPFRLLKSLTGKLRSVKQRRSPVASLTNGMLEVEVEEYDGQPSTSGRPSPTFVTAAQQKLDELLGPLGLFRRPPGTDYLQGKCFPARLYTRVGSLASSCQELVTTGTRQYGFGRTPLTLKIYDFALYLDGHQARKSRLAKLYGERLLQAFCDPIFYRKLRSSSDIEMSLMVRASRNLPIGIMRAEYERILRRRLRLTGGSADDSALYRVLQSFREEALPAEVQQAGSVKKGTVLLFSKDLEGNMLVHLNGQPLVSVQSADLCRAIMDIYVGDQPVCSKARRNAGESFARMVAFSTYAPAPQDQQMMCRPLDDGTPVCARAAF